MYARTVEGQALTFEVAGFSRRNMLMRDRQTGSIWQQATGTALAGPLAGRQLAPLGAVQAGWAAWHREHPQATLAVEPATAARGLVQYLPFAAMLDRWERMTFTFPGLGANDTRLPSRAQVAGVRLAGEARAYPLASLRPVGVVNDHLGGVPIAVTYEPGGDSVRAFVRQLEDTVVTLVADAQGLTDTEHTVRWTARGAPLAGAAPRPLPPLPVERQWWLAWSEFHPGTSIYLAPGAGDQRGADALATQR